MTRATETTPKTIASAKRAGRRAAIAGMSYDEGKTLFSNQESKLLLAWSQGHNQERAGRKGA